MYKKQIAYSQNAPSLLPKTSSIQINHIDAINDLFLDIPISHKASLEARLKKPVSLFNLDGLTVTTVQLKTNFYTSVLNFYIPSPLQCFNQLTRDQFFSTLHIDALEKDGLEWALKNGLYKGNERGLQATFVAGLTGVCYPLTPIHYQEKVIKKIDALFAQDDELDRSDEGCQLVTSSDIQISNSKLFHLISKVKDHVYEMRTPLQTWLYHYEHQKEDGSDYPMLMMHFVNELLAQGVELKEMISVSSVDDIAIPDRVNSLISTEYKHNNDPNGHRIQIVNQLYKEYRAFHHQDEISQAHFLHDIEQFKKSNYKHIRPLDRNEILAYELQTLKREYPWFQERGFVDQLEKYFSSIVEEAHANNLNIKKTDEVLSDTRIEASGAMCTLLSGASILGIDVDALAPDFNVVTLARLVSRMVMITNDIVSFYKELKELFQKEIREEFEIAFLKHVPDFIIQDEEESLFDRSSPSTLPRERAITPMRHIEVDGSSQKRRPRGGTIVDDVPDSCRSFVKIYDQYKALKRRIDNKEQTESLLYDRHRFVNELMGMSSIRDALDRLITQKEDIDPILGKYLTYLQDKDKEGVWFNDAFSTPSFVQKISKRVILNTVFSKWTQKVELHEKVSSKPLSVSGYNRLMKGAIEQSVELYNDYTVSFFDELARLGEKLDTVLGSIHRDYDDFKDSIHVEGYQKLKQSLRLVLREANRYTYFYAFMTKDIKSSDTAVREALSFVDTFHSAAESIRTLCHDNDWTDSSLKTTIQDFSPFQVDAICDALKAYKSAKTTMDVHLFKNIVLGWSFQVIWAFSAQRYNLGKELGSETMIKTLYEAINKPFEPLES